MNEKTPIMSQHFIATLRELQRIKLIENNEEMVSLNTIESFILCNHENKDMYAYTGKQVFVRSQLKDKILAAQIALTNHHPQMKLFINYGYRHPNVQRDYYFDMYNRLKNTHDGSETELEEKVHLYIASPSVAGHPTGGAIDVSIFLESQELDMGCQICDFNQLNKIETFSESITEQQKSNRMLLHDVLVQQGFAPFYGEWWHFSYGDKEWAAFYKRSHAIYDQIDFHASEGVYKT